MFCGKVEYKKVNSNVYLTTSMEFTKVLSGLILFSLTVYGDKVTLEAENVREEAVFIADEETIVNV